MPGEIPALLALLEDDSRFVLRAVTERFLTLGEEALPALRVAAGDVSPKVRSRARDLVLQIQRDEAFEDLVVYAGQADVDLETGALLHASTHTPRLVHEDWHERLDRMAEVVRREIDGKSPGRPLIRGFLSAIHKKLGFHGDAEDFYAYSNNFVHTVIERQRGIPITLILVYILLGRRVGIEIEAVGAPFRALARYRDEAFDTYIDAYAGGRLMTRADCIAALRQQGFHGGSYQHFLRPLNDRRILERMVQNTINFCESQGRSDDERNYRRVAEAFVRHRPSPPASSSKRAPPR